MLELLKKVEKRLNYNLYFFLLACAFWGTALLTGTGLVPASTALPTGFFATAINLITSV